MIVVVEFPAGPAFAETPAGAIQLSDPGALVRGLTGGEIGRVVHVELVRLGGPPILRATLDLEDESAEAAKLTANALLHVSTAQRTRSRRADG